MVKDIVKDEAVLSIKSEPATKADMQVVRDLLDTVKANEERCVGMAANMIGVHKTILVALIGDEYIAMINPKIVDKDKKFKRRRDIFRDFEAEIIQHEIDHFSGIII